MTLRKVIAGVLFVVALVFSAWLGLHWEASKESSLFQLDRAPIEIEEIRVGNFPGYNARPSMNYTEYTPSELTGWMRPVDADGTFHFALPNGSPLGESASRRLNVPNGYLARAIWIDSLKLVFGAVSPTTSAVSLDNPGRWLAVVWNDRGEIFALAVMYEQAVERLKPSLGFGDCYLAVIYGRSTPDTLTCVVVPKDNNTRLLYNGGVPISLKVRKTGR